MTAVDLVENWIDEYQQEQEGNRDAGRQDPYAPVLRTALDLHNKSELGDNFFKDFLHEQRVTGLLSRAEGLAKYMGDLDEDHNRAEIRQTLQSLTLKPDGTKRTAKEFEEVLRNIYGAVFTGHPCFSMDPKQAGALSRYFSHLAGAKNYGPQTQHELVDAADIPFTAPTLDSESQQSLAAIKNLHAAISIVEEIAIDVAKEAYPDEWTELTYAPITAATWIPFDWDGRADIPWNKLMEKRIELQVLMLQDHDERLAQLEPLISDENRETIAELRGLIQQTNGIMQPLMEEFGAYDQKNDPTLEKLAALSRRLVSSENQRIKNPSTFITLVEGILNTNITDEAQTKIVHLCSRLRNHGITYAQTHYRINSGSVLASLKERGIEIDPNMDHANYYPRVVTIINRKIQETQPKESNLGDVALSRETIVQQNALIRQTLDCIDDSSPIRFLIAETDTAVIPLTALMVAKELGVQEKIDISPLFEDREGMENAPKVVDKLLSNSDYLEYIKKRGRMCFQFGYSDSGRYDGQEAAGAFIERIKGKILKTLRQHGLQDINVVFFDTHGESIGRGAHPISMQDRIAYTNTLHTHTLAVKKSINVIAETSFQGSDGYLLHGTPEASLGLLSTSIAHITAPLRPQTFSEPDPYYNELREDALAFFESLRHTHQELSRDPDYAELIGVFTGLMPKTGSRPVKRAASSGGERALPRAIPNNGALAQVMYMANVAYGLGDAIDHNPQAFIELMKQSEQFRLRMDMAIEALKMADPEVLKSYAALYNPRFWIERAMVENNEQKKSACVQVSVYMRELGVHEKISPLIDRFTVDFDRAKQRLSELGIDISADTDKKRNMRNLHAVRLAEMMVLYETAMGIPQFGAERMGTNRDEIIRRVLGLDQTAITDLAGIFKINAGKQIPLDGLDFGKSSDLTPQDRGFDVVGEETIIPLQQIVAHNLDISRAIMNFTPNVG